MDHVNQEDRLRQIGARLKGAQGPRVRLPVSAAGLLEQCWPEFRLKVDPVWLARRLGCRVVPLAGDDKQYSGMLRLDGEVPEIGINPDDAPVRQRFTAAHELGHYCLQHRFSGGTLHRDPRESFTSAARDPQEVQANRFAAELLLPYARLHDLVFGMGTTDLHALAATFGVSTTAIHWRLKNLGWLDV